MASPATFLTAGVLRWFIAHHDPHANSERLALGGPAVAALRITGAVALTVFCAFAFTPLASILSGWLGQTPRLEAADAIVVLAGGGVLGDGTLSDTSLRRTLHGIALYQRGLAPIVLFSGAPGPGHPIESEARAALARSFGVPTPVILTEGSASTTREEAQQIARQLLPRGARRVLLVANTEGMRRATAVFARAGLEPLAAPANDVSDADDAAPEGRLDLARRVLMELCGLAYYRVVGYL